MNHRTMNAFANLSLAPMVIAMRLPILATETQASAMPGVEMMRAITEKQTALMQGALAAQWSLFASAGSFWPELLSGKVPSIVSGAALSQAATLALTPASRRVRANFRRLSRRAL